MNSDFFSLGSSPKILEEIEFSPLELRQEPLSGKIILIELNSKNLKFLEEKSDLLTNCLYLYHGSKNLKLKSGDFEKLNQFSPFFIKDTTQISKEDLAHALAKKREDEQKESFKELKKDTESELEKQIEKLEKNKSKIKKSLKRAEAIKKEELLSFKALEIIFKSQQISEIEEQLLELLENSLGLSWLRILISPLDILSDLPTIKLQKVYKTETFDMELEKKSNGKIIFAFSKNKKIFASTKNFLQKIADAISLKVQEISSENENKKTQFQWQSAFKALPFKAALIDKDYNTIEIGGSFENTTKNSQKCYQAFFNRNSPCENCVLGKNFLIESKNESLEVSSKKFFDPLSDEIYFLNFYRDFEHFTLSESFSATKSKLEELGIISGSIAHELNNPLGGIRILIQLLEEELRESGEDLEEIKILSQSTEKCIEIIKELLKFTRPEKAASTRELKISDYFKQLQIFTQAYLLAEGFILKIPEKLEFNPKVFSPDATLSIKLLEALSYFAKNLRSQSKETKDIYLSTSLYKSAKNQNQNAQEHYLRINFQCLKRTKAQTRNLTAEPLIQKNSDHPSPTTLDQSAESLVIEVGEAEIRDLNAESLEVLFKVDVKASETDV